MVAAAQTPSPAFETASIRPIPAEASGNERFRPIMRELGRNSRHPGEIPMAAPDRIRLKDWTLLDLIAAAYSVRATQVTGPDWLAADGFEVEATLPAGTPKQALNAMLQTLLVERFGLQAHRATKTGRGYALVIGKGGPRLSPPLTGIDQSLSKEDQKAQLQQRMEAERAALQRRMESTHANGGSLNSFRGETWPSVTSEELAAHLVSYTHAPVVDETGLTGKYSASIEVSSNGDEPGGTIFDAVEKLGLKLEPRKVSVETVVVDGVSRAPTPN